MYDILYTDKFTVIKQYDIRFSHFMWKIEHAQTVSTRPFPPLSKHPKYEVSLPFITI